MEIIVHESLIFYLFNDYGAIECRPLNTLTLALATFTQMTLLAVEAKQVMLSALHLPRKPKHSCCFYNPAESL